MSKKLLKIVLCSLLLGGVASGVTGCKDYDDDITQINGTTDRLGQQLADLNNALAAANQAAEAAAAAAKQAQDDAKAAAEKGDQAAAEAAAANAAAAAAKQAAEEAKAAALREVIAQTEALRAEIAAAKSLSDKNAEDIAALVGRINGIENGLANIDLTDVNAQLGEQAGLIAQANSQIEALQVQIDALEGYKERVEALETTVENWSEKVAAIDGLIADMTDLKGRVAANETAISEIRGELAELSAKITTEVTNAINTIAGVISQRLTSVTLIPELYVDGIPTISMESAKYVKLVYNATNHNYVPANGKNTFIITNNATEAQYRLNPGTVTENDIIKGGLSYVSRVATSRSGDVVDDIINVADASVSGDGILTVKIGKSTTESLNRVEANKINIVSLKVPIAPKHLFTEQGETSASVYSEFSRIEETYFTPELMFVPGKYIGKNLHELDSISLYNSKPGELISKNLVYNKPFDLYELVEGCKFIAPNHNPLTREQLQAYGMDIRFHVATRAFVPTDNLVPPAGDHTNQQQYVKLSGENNSVLTPITTTGATGNQVIIGKQPIIVATLFDKTNDNIINVGYFKVNFTAEDMEDVVIDWNDIATTGDPCSGASFDFGWQDMSERVLEHLNVENGVAAGMSKDEFTKVYGGNFTITPANDAQGTLTPNVVLANKDASIPVMTWTVTPAQLGHLVVGNNVTAFTKTITFTDPQNLHPNVVINLKWTVSTPVGATTLGKTDPLKWNNEMMKVYVVPMEIPYVSGTSPKAYYDTNILEGREKPYVKGILPCAYWDINYASDSDRAARVPLAFQAGYGHWGMNLTNQANLNTISFTLDKTSSSDRTLACNGGNVVLSWKSNINGMNSNPDNRYEFATSTLKVVPILSLETTTAQGITDNSHAVTISLKNNLRVKDAYGNTVATVATSDSPYAADYWDFYGLNNPAYGTDITVADNPEGTLNVRTLAQLNMTADVDAVSGDLTFQNNGSPLQGNAYLIVPVKVTHIWGTLSGKVAVPLNKKLAAPRR